MYNGLKDNVSGVITKHRDTPSYLSGWATQYRDKYRVALSGQATHFAYHRTLDQINYYILLLLTKNYEVKRQLAY